MSTYIINLKHVYESEKKRIEEIHEESKHKQRDDIRRAQLYSLNTIKASYEKAVNTEVKKLQESLENQKAAIAKEAVDKYKKSEASKYETVMETQYWHGFNRGLLIIPAIMGCLGFAYFLIKQL